MATSTTHEKLDNAAVAERLEAFAALLDLAGASYYTARAYRRAAELIRALEAPVAELVSAGRVRELRGIGPGIEARLRELVETGDIAELRELEREVAPELVGLGRYLGLSAKRFIRQAGGRDRAGSWRGDGGRVPRRCAGGAAARGARDRAEDRGQASRGLGARGTAAPATRAAAEQGAASGRGTRGGARR